METWISSTQCWSRWPVCNITFINIKESTNSTKRESGTGAIWQLFNLDKAEILKENSNNYNPYLNLLLLNYYLNHSPIWIYKECHFWTHQTPKLQHVLQHKFLSPKHVHRWSIYWTPANRKNKLHSKHHHIFRIRGLFAFSLEWHWFLHLHLLHYFWDYIKKIILKWKLTN